MESRTLKFLLTLFLFLSTTFTTTSATVRPVKSHIKKACKPTPYPRLCETSLSLYASQTKHTQQELCRAALVSSLKAAENVSSLVSNLSRRKSPSPSPYKAAVIRDCVDNLKDSIDELQRSIAAIKSLSRSDDVEFQVSSIKTWVSAAETNVITCTDELSGGSGGRKVRSTVKNEVKTCAVNVIRQISNALSLINNFKYKS